MKYYIIAGEASGDLHGSNLIKSLKDREADANFRIWGGDLMQAAGGKLVKHYRDLAFMGFVEVAKNIRTILNNIKFCKEDIQNYEPDALILVDYPGFNLRIAKWAKKKEIKVLYYISPQLWAWHSSRVHGIKQNVDRMFVILPFEKDFYKQYDYEVDFVGHPLLDVVDQHPVKTNFQAANQLSNQPIIALLPGSRRQEIKRMLSIMLETVKDFSDYQFVIGGAPSIPLDFYHGIMNDYNSLPVKIVSNQTYDLLQHSKAAMVTSGTATLETALFGVPQVVCYKGNQLSYWIARRLVNVKYISLVNLIVDRPLVKELIQDQLTTQQLKQALMNILNPLHQSHLESGYAELRKKLGNKGASQRLADLIIKSVNDKITV